VKTALISLFAFATVALFAREEPLPDSVSPDKRYRIIVAEVGGRISYRVTDTSNGGAVISLRSSYQPDSGSDDWGFQQSLGATVKWRTDSRCVAIGEANHRRIGTVLIARRTPKGFQQVPLSSEALMRASKLPWERGRLFFGEWGARDSIAVGLIGLVWADPESTPPEKRHRKEFSCGFTIALPSGDVISIDPQTDETK
jgi:hypothetical protein